MSLQTFLEGQLAEYLIWESAVDKLAPKGDILSEGYIPESEEGVNYIIENSQILNDLNVAKLERLVEMIDHCENAISIVEAEGVGATKEEKKIWDRIKSYASKQYGSLKSAITKHTGMKKGMKFSDWRKAGSTGSQKAKLLGGGGILVSAAAITAYLAYKNYMSKSARVCAGKKGAEKKECMTHYKQLAKEAKMRAIKAA